jgi:hypothetical protein
MLDLGTNGDLLNGMALAAANDAAPAARRTAIIDFLIGLSTT